jgi:phage gp29-like protein
MATLLDQFGRPLDRTVLAAPQTASVAQLARQALQPMLEGLSPARLAQVLRRADDGWLTDQHRLFADMEDRDGHLLAEINKRKLALLDLDWRIDPPRHASAAEEQAAAWAQEVVEDLVDSLEDLILAAMDGPGHGFAAIEIEWRRDGGEWLPTFHPRPQEWFQMDASRRRLCLIDGTREGRELLPFGWVLHTHGKAKTGYLGRMGLYRALVWPFLCKHFSISDLAEFLETYGLPIISGKFRSGASPEEQASLLQAVIDLGHDARAILPQDMSLEIAKVSTSGDADSHLAMVHWAEGAMSKVILGQRGDEARSAGIGSGQADFQREVRRDIRNADARQVAATLTSDVVYPLLALNRGVDSLRRCPRFQFDTGEPEDLTTYAQALPELVGVGMRIPVAWAHERLRVPLPEGDEAVLGAPAPVPAPAGEPATPPAPGSKSTPAPAPAALSAVVALGAGAPRATDSAAADQAVLDAALAQLPGADIHAAMQALLAPAIAALQAGETPDQAGDALLGGLPEPRQRRAGDAARARHFRGRCLGAPECRKRLTSPMRAGCRRRTPSPTSKARAMRSAFPGRTSGRKRTPRPSPPPG